MGTNLIPEAGIILYPFLGNIVPIITENAVSWNIISSAVSNLQASVTPFMQAWLVFITPNSGRVDRNNMNVARKAVRMVMAAFARAYLLYNPLVSAAMLAQMGFGPKPKPIPGWSTVPILSVSHAVRQVRIRFTDTDTSARQGKAVGAQCIEVATAFSAVKPVSVNDYTAMHQATKSPLVITCTEEQLGSCMWFWARWISGANDEGAWSAMYSTYFT
ncbi:hypothetical protein FACS1894200_09790 [Spirochaetia bacterium]|nr:hypothetical protein FACS1894200_09790 [Spirochaetia bacterium]